MMMMMQLIRSNKNGKIYASSSMPQPDWNGEGKRGWIKYAREVEEILLYDGVYFSLIKHSEGGYCVLDYISGQIVSIDNNGKYLHKSSKKAKEVAIETWDKNKAKGFDYYKKINRLNETKRNFPTLIKSDFIKIKIWQQTLF